MSADRPEAAGGFTLVEVLIALAIIAFGLIAVFGQLNQSALAAARLRDKTFAHWIAMNLITEKRLSGQFPADGTESDEIEMANARWRYEIRFTATSVEDLRRADVTVAFADTPDRPLATASGFFMETPGGPGAAVPAAGWPVVSGAENVGSGTEAPPPAATPSVQTPGEAGK
jgi:general secretion pathway protein I